MSPLVNYIQKILLAIFVIKEKKKIYPNCFLLLFVCFFSPPRRVLNISETSHEFGLFFSKIDAEPSDWFVFRCKYGCRETTETQVKFSTQVKYCQESTTKVSLTGFRYTCFISSYECICISGQQQQESLQATESTSNLCFSSSACVLDHPWFTGI